MALDLELDKLTTGLKKLKPKKVLVQLPEGIKKHSFEIQKIINKLGIGVVISGETCWGGCCVSADEAKIAGADLIVHFGHGKFYDVDFPVLYIEVKDLLNLVPILKKSFEKLEKFSTIGLSLSIQHMHDLDKIIKTYKNAGKKVILSAKKGLVACEGHIVGCQYDGLKEIEKSVEAFVIIGNNFHSMGAAITVDKPVILIDVYNDEVREMTGIKDKTIRERAISIEKLKDAKKVVIISEIKPGQKFGNANLLKEKLEAAGKEVILINMNEMTNEKIMNFYNVDAFIELACPRIAIDDFAKYDKPILTYKEALVAIGQKSWEDLLESGFL